MADFDPFANQGGPAAWDPEHANDSKKQADELLKNADGDPGAGPRDFGSHQPEPELGPDAAPEAGDDPDDASEEPAIDDPDRD